MSLLFHQLCRRVCNTGLALALLVFTVGCGESTSTISGIVRLDGKPMSLADNAHGTVMFQPASRQGPTLNGSIEGGGKFKLLAGTTSQVSPGVYIATVSAVEVLPAKEGGAQPEGKRITPDKYASSSESGLRVVIKPGENDVVLELESEKATAEIPDEPGEAENAISKPDSQELIDKD